MNKQKASATSTMGLAFPRVARSDMVTQRHVLTSGSTVMVYSGRVWTKVKLHEDMIGLRFGELVKTRTPRSTKAAKKGKK